MRAVVLSAWRAPLALTDLPEPEPGPGQVRIRVQASGLCGTDVHIWEGNYLALSLPWVLGHEPVGTIDALGPGVTTLAVGDRVGVSWTQRGCGRCVHCAGARERYCRAQVTWGELGGGHADYMLAEAAGCTRLPDTLGWEVAAPMFCAGYTVMSGYRNAAPRPGDRVAVLGIGGLGHLALQIARAMGHETVAVTSSAGKAEALRQFGADEVVVVRHHAGKELRAAGGADIVLSTSNNMRQNAEILRGLREEGRLVTMAIGHEPIPIDPNLVLGKQLVIKGSMQNERRDLVEVLQLAADGKVVPALEIYSLADAPRAFERLVAGQVRYRAVLVPGAV